MNCLYCGKEIFLKRKGTKWCSKTCASAGWKLNHPEHKDLKRRWDIENADWKRQYEREKLKVSDSLRDYRKKIHREYSLRTYFGITVDQYNELLKKQNDRCAICLRHQSEFNKSLAVDHSHESGEIRGILCLECNKNLVRNHEDPEIFIRAADYLRNSKTGWIVPEKYKKGKFIK